VSEVVKLDKATTEVAEVPTSEVAELEEHDTPDQVVSVIPDPDWGWVGESPKAYRIAGVIVALMLLGMIIGNHTSHIEDIYLIGFAVFILLIIFKDWALNKMSLRQK
jgi:hypothetical protein